jgi:nucleotide-binding universal stress UspA family protein
MFTSIVVAFDGSDHATRALKIAAGIAVADKASLGIIHVVDPGHLAISSEKQHMAEVEHMIKPAQKLLINYENAPAEVVSTLTQAAAESQRTAFQLAKYIVQLAESEASKAGMKDIVTEISVGNPAEEILKFAQTREADLIVTGRRGFGKLKKVLLGSTSNKVAQLADCSCLTVR